MSRSSGWVGLLAALVVWALLLPARITPAQQFDTSQCFCAARLGWPTGDVPRNAQFLLDGVRFDLDTFRFVLTAIIGTGVGNTPKEASTTPFLATGLHVLVPEEELLVGRKYLVGAFNAPDQPPETTGVGGSFRVQDYLDETPPTLGDFVFTGEVFTAECGAQALRAETKGLGDDFLTGARMPLLVVLEAGAERFETVTSAFPGDDDDVLVARAPYLGRCIRDEGVESLPFEPGQEVRATVTVYDYAGNAGEPLVKTIEWPVEQATNGTGGVGGDSGAGGNPSVAANGGGGCSAAEDVTSVPVVVLVLLIAIATIRRSDFS